MRISWMATAACAVVLVLGLFVLFKYLSRKKMKQEAFDKQLREQALSQVLKNSRNDNEKQGGSVLAQPLLKADTYLSRQTDKPDGLVVKLTVKGRKKESYIVNPQEHINIGRAPDKNKIVLEDPACALCHCELFYQQGAVCLRNVASDCHTILKRKSKTTELGQKNIQVHTGDCFLIGAYSVEISLLDYTGKTVI